MTVQCIEFDIWKRRISTYYALRLLGQENLIVNLPTSATHSGFVTQDDMRIFNVNTEPYASFLKYPNFAKDVGVINALEYLKNGHYPYKWKYFGDWKLQEQDRRSEVFQRNRRASVRIHLLALVFKNGRFTAFPVL